MRWQCLTWCITTSLNQDHLSITLLLTWRTMSVSWCNQPISFHAYLNCQWNMIVLGIPAFLATHGAGCITSWSFAVSCYMYSRWCHSTIRFTSHIRDVFQSVNACWCHSILVKQLTFLSIDWLIKRRIWNRGNLPLLPCCRLEAESCFSSRDPWRRGHERLATLYVVYCCSTNLVITAS